MMCSCGRMQTPRGVDLCQACEQDYFEERWRDQQEERRQYDEYATALERERYESDMREEGAA